jgi:regulator of sigma E protease
MVALIKAAQLLLSLSILVFMHELGHYLTARWFKTRVEKFYLFMNPWFSIYKKKIGDTEWGLGWLPLGGYVKIAGMVDESMDTEQLKQPPQPWEFRTKPAWQRLIIMLGGIIVNLILGFAIYSMVLFVWGETVLPTSSMPYGIQVDDRVKSWGFENGDRILRINDEEVNNLTEIRRSFFFNDVEEVTLERNGQTKVLTFDQDLGQQLVDSNIRSPFGVRMPLEVAYVVDGSRAAAAGLSIGDRLMAMDSIPMQLFDEATKYIKAHPEMPIQMTLQSPDGTVRTLTATPDSLGTLGVQNKDVMDFEEFATETISYSGSEAVVSGFQLAARTLQEYVLSLRFLFSKSGATQVGSLVTFGSVFDAGWDWEVFWRNTAFFSLILAFMNLLPIPALDGGHVMFLLYEMIAGKPASEKFLERAQYVGIVLLMALMIFALGNDIWRLLTGQFR